MLAGQVTIIHRDYVSLPLLQVGSVRASDAATLAPRKAKGDQPGAKQRDRGRCGNRRFIRNRRKVVGGIVEVETGCRRAGRAAPGTIVINREVDELSRGQREGLGQRLVQSKSCENP